MVQKSDDDVNRALAAISAPSISYRNFDLRPLTSGEPKRTDPAAGGFRLLVAAIPEAAGLGLSQNRAGVRSAEASVETLLEQPPLTEERPNASAVDLRARGLAPKPSLLEAGPSASEPRSTGQSDRLGGASVRPAPAHPGPDSSRDKTPLAAVFLTLNASRLPPANPAQAEQELQNIFSIL